MSRLLTCFITIAISALCSGCVIFTTTVKDPTLAKMTQRVLVFGTADVNKAKQSFQATIPTEGGGNIEISSGHDGDNLHADSPIRESIEDLKLLKEILP